MAHEAARRRAARLEIGQLQDVDRRAVGREDVVGDADGEPADARRLAGKADDQCVAGLQRDERLEDRRLHGVGDGNDGEHDADRAGQVRDLTVRVVADLPLRHLAGGRLENGRAGEPVLEDLVFDVAESRFRDRGGGEFLSLPGEGVGEIAQQTVDAGVGPVRE